MQADGRAHAAQEASGAHDRPAGAGTGHQRFGVEPLVPQLRPDLRSGRSDVRLGVLVVRELAREERIGRRRGELIGAGDASEKAARLLDTSRIVAPKDVRSGRSWTGAPEDATTAGTNKHNAP